MSKSIWDEDTQASTVKAGPRSIWDEPDSELPTVAPKRNLFARANDFAIDTGNAAAGLVKSGIDFVAPGSAASKAVGDFIKDGEESQSDFKKAGRKNMAREMATADGEIEKVKVYARHVADDPMEVVGQAVGNVGPFKALGMALKAAGWGTKAMMTASGAMSAGEVRGNILDKVLGKKDADLAAENTEYAALRTGGMSEADAKKEIGTKFIQHLPELMATAAVGSLGGKYGLEGIASGMGKQAKGRIAATGISMLDEGAQGGVEQLSTNVGVRRIDGKQELGEDVLLNAVQEGLPGGVGGGASHRSAPKAEDQGITAPSAPAIAAGVTSQAGTQTPGVTPANTGPTASQQFASEAFTDVLGDETATGELTGMRAQLAKSLSDIKQHDGEEALTAAVTHLAQGDEALASKLTEAANGETSHSDDIIGYVRLNDAIRRESGLVEGVEAHQGIASPAVATEQEEPATPEQAPAPAPTPLLQAQVEAVRGGLLGGMIVQADHADAIDLTGLSIAHVTGADGVTQYLAATKSDQTAQEFAQHSHTVGAEQAAAELFTHAQGSAVVQRVGADGVVHHEAVVAPGEVGGVQQIEDTKTLIRPTEHVLAERMQEAQAQHDAEQQMQAQVAPQAQEAAVAPVEASQEASPVADGPRFFKRKKKAKTSVKAVEFNESEQTGAASALVEGLNSSLGLKDGEEINPASIREVTPKERHLTRLQAAVHAAFGKKVVFVHAPDGLMRMNGQNFNHFNGVTDGKTLVLNIQGEHVLNTLSHELNHILEQAHPVIYERLESVVLSRMSAKAAEGLHASLTKAMQGESKADSESIALKFRQEAVAEGVGEMGDDASLWGDVFKHIGREGTQAKTLYEKVLEVIGKFKTALVKAGFMTGAKDINQVKAAITEAYQAWAKESAQTWGNTQNLTKAELQTREQSASIVESGKTPAATSEVIEFKKPETATIKPATAPKKVVAKKEKKNVPATTPKDTDTSSGAGVRPRGNVPKAGRVEGSKVPAQKPGKAEGSTEGDAGSKQELTALPGAPKVPGFHGPDPRIVAVAESYAKSVWIKLTRQSSYVEVDPARAKRIADAYGSMKHDPSNPLVKAAFKNLIKQTTAQYQALVKAGYKFWFIDFNAPGNAEYASSPWNAMRDMRANQQMGVFPTSDGFGSGDKISDNPLEATVTEFEWPSGGLDGPMKPVLANDLFRAVHDAFGHGMEGAGFRAQGEENAWQAHARLFTGTALGAITSETRGQNSWLNYGPSGESNQNAAIGDTVFADQKTGLMPEWTWTEGRVDAPAKKAGKRVSIESMSRKFDGKADAAWTADRVDALLRNYAYTQDDSRGKAYAAWVSPEEFLKATTPANGVEKLEAERTPLNASELASQKQEIRLDVKSMKDGGIELSGHEGRHRMMALRDAGVTSVPVVLFLGQGQTLSEKSAQYVSPQSWGEGLKAQEGFLTSDLTPITWKHAKDLKAKFVNAQAKVSFARTATPEFKTWFGDSKVVDAEGKPQVMYHGSNSEFRIFRGGRIYFTADPSYASRYATHNDANVMPVYLSIKNPLDLTALGDSSTDGFIGALKAAGVDTTDIAQRSLPVWAQLHNRDVLIADRAAAAGYDGIILKEYNGQYTTAYVAFKPTQIKSATGNNGQYNPADSRITFSRNPTKMESVADALQYAATGDLKMDLGDALDRRAWAEAYQAAKTPGEIKKLLSSLGDKIIDSFADSKVKLINWIKSTPLSNNLKQSLEGDIRRADTVRTALEGEVKDSFTAPMMKAITAASKSTKRSSDKVKKDAGLWMTAKYVPTANNFLISKDRAILTTAQQAAAPLTTGTRSAATQAKLDAAVTKAQAELQERIADVHGAIGQVKTRGVGGGMNNAEAAQMMQRFEARTPVALLNDIAAPIYAMMDWKKAKDISSGKVTQTAVNSWVNAADYVPLTGDPRFDRESSDVFSAGDKVNQEADKAMNGRKDSIADDAIDAAFSATIKSVNFAAMQDFKRSLNKAYNEAKTAGQDIGLTGEPVTGIMRTGDHVIIYRDTARRANGTEFTSSYAFKFDDARIMEALRDDHVEKVNAMIKILGTPTRWYARMVTQFMPMFAPINFVRDIWERSELLRTRKLYDQNGGLVDVKKVANRAIAEAINRDVWKASMMKAFKKGGMTQARGDLEEMIRLGGSSTTGDFLSRSAGSLEKEIRGDVGKTGHAANVLLHKVESWGDMFEMVPSLAIYRGLKAEGMTPKDAAAAVLDLMNFRKHGSKMSAVRALYIFAQPVATGGHNLAKHLSTRTGQVRFAAQVAIGVALYALLRGAWGDDDDEELGNNLDNLSNFTVERSIPVKLGGMVLKAPVGFGPPQLAWVTAVSLSRFASGRYSAGDAAGELGKAFFKTMAPVSPSEIEVMKRPGDFFMQTITPTILKPLANIYADQTAMGAQLTPAFKDPAKLKSEQAKRNTAPIYSEIAAWVHSNIGVDIYPDHLKAIADGLLIGPAREIIALTSENDAKRARGEPGKMPIVSSLIDNLNDRQQLNGIYSRVRGELDRNHREYATRKADGEVTPEMEVLEQAYKKFTSQEKMFGVQRAALKKNTTLDDDTRSERTKAIEERADAAHRKLLVHFMQASS